MTSDSDEQCGYEDFYGLNKVKRRNRAISFEGGKYEIPSDESVSDDDE